MERTTGIEPAFSAWEADVLPLNYIRMTRRFVRSRQLPRSAVPQGFRAANLRVAHVGGPAGADLTVGLPRIAPLSATVDGKLPLRHVVWWVNRRRWPLGRRCGLGAMRCECDAAAAYTSGPE